MVLDDQRTRLRVALLLNSFFVVLWSLLWLDQLFSSLPLTFTQAVSYGVASGYFLLLWAWVLFQRHRWRQVNAQRQAIAAGRGRHEWLLPPVPVRPERALERPMTIALKPSWRGFLAWWVLTLVGIAAIAWPLGVPVLLVGLLALTLILLGVGLASEGWSERIEVGPRGLVVKRRFLPANAIDWEEAQVFVLWSWGKRAWSAQHYELAGPTTIHHWRVLPRQWWWDLSQPAESWETYEVQTTALRALVEAATGLPLYEVG